MPELTPHTVLTPSELKQALSISDSVYQQLKTEGMPRTHVGRSDRYIWGNILKWLEKRSERLDAANSRYFIMQHSARPGRKPKSTTV